MLLKEPQVKSTDIDRNKLENQHLATLTEEFPGVTLTTLARFLSHSNYDVSQARKRLLKAEQWNALHWPILKVDCLHEINKGRIFMNGYDKEGHPLVVFRSRYHDRNDRDPEEMAKSIVWWAEYALHHMPDDKSKVTILMDRTGACRRNSDMKFFKKYIPLLSVSLKLYPAGIRRTIVYPTSLLFYSMWSVVKWFVNSKTRRQVQTCLTLDGVREFITDEWIPANMDGKAAFEFNADDYHDPYPEDIIQAALKRRERREARQRSDMPKQSSLFSVLYQEE